jgi:4-hydroxy-tetrahydrodipicolinate synthase
MKESAFHGVWATTLLDIRSDGSINFDAIFEQVGAFKNFGLDGVYCNGTASEFHNQTDAEFEQISEVTANAAKSCKIPFQLSAAHPAPQIALSRISSLVKHEPCAIQVTLPDWTKIDFTTAVTYLAKCAEYAQGRALVLYNPPHAKTVLNPSELWALCDAVPEIKGIKCGGGQKHWYKDMRPVFERVSVFIPGHNYSSGVSQGAAGSYSNMACLSPKMAASWRDLSLHDSNAAQELEQRVTRFIKDAFYKALKAGVPGFACDKAMAIVGGWCEISPNFLWPHAPLCSEFIEQVRTAAANNIPEFL